MIESNKQMQVEYVKIQELHPADYNPRRMSVEDRRHIQESLSKYGFAEPVVVNRHPDRMNIIVGGHQRVTVAKEVELADAFQNNGAQLVKYVASKTGDDAGDGTTTATLLAQAIIRE